MSGYDDVNTSTIAMIGLLSAIVILAIILLLEVVFYQVEAQQFEVKDLDRSPTQAADLAARHQAVLEDDHWDEEGKLVAIVEERDAHGLLGAMRSHPLGREAAIIGRVVAEHPGRVVLRTLLGTRRAVDMLAGEQLPRIC